MRLFKKQPRRRGPGKSPEAKAKEQKAKVDEFLDRTYLKYLREHPNFAEQVSMSRFDLGGSEEGGYPEPPDFIEKVKEVKSAMDLIKGEFGGKEETGGFMGLLKDILQSDKDGELAKAMAGAISSISQGFKAQVPQPKPQRIEEKPAPKLEQPKQPTQEQKQNEVVAYIEQLIAKSPKEAALEIYEAKNSPEDLRSLAYFYAINNPFDELVVMMTDVVPAFLAETIDKIDKKWLAALYDELNILKNKENEGKTGADEGKEV